MSLEQRTPTPPPSDSEPPRSIDDEDLGGESPCFAHLLDDDGRMPDRRSTEPAADS